MNKEDLTNDHQLNAPIAGKVLSPKVDLRLDWCSHEAAKYAVEHWHYSKTMPVAKNVRVGVWENKKFIGAIIFSWGANPNLSKTFNIKMVECVELVRIALAEHQAQVSKMISIATKMIKNQSPGVRLLISFADQRENHHGGIYQASNWIYLGETNKKFDFDLNGKILQRRAYTGSNFGGIRLKVPIGAKKFFSPPKHRYAYPLDEAMRKQIEPLRKPYPKRATGEVRNALDFTNQETGGANPTVALNL